MIVEMCKYGLLVHSDDHENLLVKLQGFGALHIVKRKHSFKVEEVEELYNEKKQLVELLSHLSKRKISNTDNDAKSCSIEHMYDLLEKEKDINKRIDFCNKAIERYDGWDDFDYMKLEVIQDNNYDVLFYKCSVKDFNKLWLQAENVFVVNKTSHHIYFVCIEGKGMESPIPISPVDLPDNSKSYFLQLLNSLKEEKSQVVLEIDCNTVSLLETLEKRITEITSKTAFLKVKNYDFRGYAEGCFFLLQFWLPQHMSSELETLLNENDILFYEDEKDNDYPILLKNNAFSRLFEPIGQLFMLPKHTELDLTPLFAPFFILLFGFCIGDAGYGMILFVLAFIIQFRVKTQMKKLLRLVQVLALGSVVFGFFSGTVMGVSFTDYNIIEPLSDLVFNSTELFQLSLWVGLVQIIFGMLINTINFIIQGRKQEAVSIISWIILIITAIIFNSFELKIEGVDVLEKAIYGTAVAGIILFSVPLKKVSMRVGAGVWAFYTTVTGIFGDLLSYIRLFALGTASAILGLVINQMAMQFGQIDYVGPVLMILILLVGHSVNVFLATLGAFVHSMRLTFVEFYKNAGFQGGGVAYKPFSKD